MILTHPALKMKDFYMTLLSDSSMKMFPSNKQSEFTVKLDHPIEIDEETWEVALAEIATPSEVLNITEDNNFFFLAFPDQHSLYTKFGVENITEMCSNDSSDCYKFKLKIPTGNYMSPKYLVEEMQASIDKFEKGILKHVNAYVSITYDALSQRLKLSAQNERQVRIIFPNQFAHILGLDPTMNGKPIGNEENMFKFNVNLHNNFRSLYVYSDIASFTFIGDTVAPLLRIVPFSHNSKTGYVYKEFKTLHYVSVSKSVVDQVHITIKTENGSVVPFITGKTILKLHFRRKKK